MKPSFDIQLKQHTPMIHFQFDQPGAALRASDLKPRLDKFLGIDSKKTRYRLEVIPINEPKTVNNNEEFRNEPYFGNRGNPKKKFKIEYLNGVRLIINTPFQQEIGERIKASLNEFFALESFGTRNNKGYGCFYPESATQADFETALKSLHLAGKIGDIYYWDCDDKILFHSIALFNRWIKSGINIKPAYYKSILFCYADTEKGLIWDKRFVKEKFLTPPSLGSFGTKAEVWSNPPVKGKEYRFIRAMLGLSTDNAWSSKNYKNYARKLSMNESHLVVSCAPGLSEPSKQLEVERIPNPFMYKVFRGGSSNRVYVFALKSLTSAKDETKGKIFNIHPELLGKDFEFGFIDGNKKNTLNKIESLKTPDSLDYNDFLEYAEIQIKNSTPQSGSSIPKNYNGNSTTAGQKAEFIAQHLRKNLKKLEVQNG